MINVLIVDEQDDRRAATVDALCELPGIEVCATASDARGALAVLSFAHVDAVVAASDLASAAIVTLIDRVCRRGLIDVIVMVTTRVLLPGMRDYWRDLGACDVVDTLPELVAVATRLAEQRRRKDDRRERIAQRIEAAVMVGRAKPALTYASAASGLASVTPLVRAPQPATIVSVGEVLRDAGPRLARVVHDEIDLVLEIAPDVPRVRCTVGDVERIALHLVLDAAEVNPLGGKIWLIVERDGQRHVRIEVLDSSGLSRTPGLDADGVRMIASRYGGELRVVQLGNATSLQVILPAIVDAAS